MNIIEAISTFIGSLFTFPFICCGWLIVGGLAGGLARNIMGGGRSGLINSIVLGLIGAFVGGILIGILDIGRPERGIGGVIASLLVATMGAIALIAIGRLVRGQAIRR